MNDESLRILSLDVENVLRVVAVRIRPDGHVIELTGKNGGGKSSTIDALWCALGGEKMIPPDPIHDGAEEGNILVDLGNDSGLRFRIRRKIRKADNEKGYATSLTIEDEDGKRLTKPQKILDDLIGALSCDPLKFVEMQPQQQYEVLKGFVPGIDFGQIAADNKRDYELRTDTNRRAKAARTRADAVIVGDLVNAVLADESALVEQLAGAAEKNAAVERFKAEQDARLRSAAELETKAEQLRAQAGEVGKEIERLQKVQADLLANAETWDEKAADFRLEHSDAGDPPTGVDTTDLQRRISEARSHNSKVEEAKRAAAERDRLNDEAMALEKQSEELTKAMEARDAAKEKAISEAKIPVPGIEFGDGFLKYNGHPLETASQAQKLSIAIGIAVAMQPKLRFVTTKNAALLDDDSWAALVKLAEEQDLLIIAETVNSDRPTAVVIEDGTVAKVGGKN